MLQRDGDIRQGVMAGVYLCVFRPAEAAESISDPS
jgi:hypothetical protein